MAICTLTRLSTLAISYKGKTGTRLGYVGRDKGGIPLWSRSESWGIVGVRVSAGMGWLEKPIAGEGEEETKGDEGGEGAVG